MKGFLISFVIFLILGAGAIFGLYQIKYKPLKENLTTTEKKLKLLEEEKLAIGETVPVYILNHSVKRGVKVKATDFDEMVVPTSLTPNDVITDLENIGKGFIYKTDFGQKTLLTKSLLMPYEEEELIQFYDIPLDALPTSIKEGEYIDYRATLPQGESFIILERKKIEKINGSVIEVKVSEAELHIIETFKNDLALYEDVGLKEYVTKYVEPGLDGKIAPYYPVSKDAENIVLVSPNIWDKSRCINTELREYIDDQFKFASIESNQDYFGKVASGVSATLGEVKSAYELAVEKREAELEAKKLAEATGEGEEYAPVGEEVITEEQPAETTEEPVPAE